MKKFLLTTAYAAVVLGSFLLGREVGPPRSPRPIPETTGVTAEAVAEAEGVVLYRFSGDRMVVPYYVAIGRDGKFASLR